MLFLFLMAFLAASVPLNTASRAADLTPADADGLLAHIVAPHSVTEFMDKYYEERVLRVDRGGDATHFADLRAGSYDELDAVVRAFKEDGSLSNGIKVSVDQAQGMRDVVRRDSRLRHGGPGDANVPQ